MDDLTRQGTAALKSGNKTEARKLLAQAVRRDKRNIMAWYALSFAVDGQKEKIFCLQQVLQVDPYHVKAQQRMAKLTGQPVGRERQESKAETAVSSSPPRTTISRLRQTIFSEPRLPQLLVFLAVFFVVSDGLIMLIGQTPGYWGNFSVGSTFFPWLTPFIRIHPLLFGAVILVNTLIVWIALRRLSYKPAIILWMLVSYQHLRSFVGWARCSLEQMIGASPGICTAVDVTLTIAAGLLLGFALAVTLLPRGTSRQLWDSKTPRIARSAWIAGGVWLLFLVGWLMWVILTPPKGWVLLDVETLPPARANAGLSYDTDRQRAVLFGGGTEYLGGEWYDWEVIGDTWEWDGRRWQEFTLPISPSPRLHPAMAYDPQRKITMLFGGLTANGMLGDTWEWDGQQWRELSPTTSPTPTCCATMFYDPQRERIVLYGGLSSNGDFPSDSWEWDGSAWQLFASDPDAPGGTGVPVVYESARDQIIAVFPHWGTYVWGGQGWQQRLPVSETPWRVSAAMAYDTAHELTILYGGTKDNAYQPNTWRFDGTSWEQIMLPANPGGVSGHKMFYDEIRGTVVLFGGDMGAGTRNSMWELHLP